MRISVKNFPRRRDQEDDYEANSHAGDAGNQGHGNEVSLTRQGAASVKEDNGGHRSAPYDRSAERAGA